MRLGLFAMDAGMESRQQAALRCAQDLCKANAAKLVYLTIFGSGLYGTGTGSSDLDLRGIFLPSLPSVILCKAKKSLHHSTGVNESRNSPADIDIDLWSVENWILHLLPEGDMGALDLLFSPSNAPCVLYDDGLLDPVFQNPLRFLNLAGNDAYVRYCIGQAKKFGIKGSRLGALRLVWRWLQSHETPGKLADYLQEIAEKCGHGQYCFVKKLPDGPALALCGKIHSGGIKMPAFRCRVFQDMERFGARAREAEENRGLDFKALSHALRALDQMEQLLLTGRIVFPLASRERLRAVKRGETPWLDLESIITRRLEEVRSLHSRLAGKHIYDRAAAERFLLGCYGLT